MPLSQVKPIDLDLKNPLLDRYQTWLHNLRLQSQRLMGHTTLDIIGKSHNTGICWEKGRPFENIAVSIHLNIPVILVVFQKKNYNATELFDLILHELALFFNS